ncbi:MAG: hypothetical protein R3B74_04915 [Nitrospirales bacterium]|nr:hypothetical protein [Nitrospirales bacterium]
MSETQMIEWVHFERSGYFPLPVEPLYDLKVAANLIPMHYPSLRKLLSRHKAQFPARYRRSTGGRRIRLLSASEIRRIRPMVIDETNPDHIFKAFLRPRV